MLSAGQWMQSVALTYGPSAAFTFGFDVVRECPGVPTETLPPRNAWHDTGGYNAGANRLAGQFRTGFKTYESCVSEEIRTAGPA